MLTRRGFAARFGLAAAAGRMLPEKYFKQGKPCPVLVSCGHDPMLFLAGGNELRFGPSAECELGRRP